MISAGFTPCSCAISLRICCTSTSTEVETVVPLHPIPPSSAFRIFSRRSSTAADCHGPAPAGQPSSRRGGETAPAGETETTATVAAAGGATDRPRGAGQAVCVRSFAGAHRRGQRGAGRRDPAADPGDPHRAAQVRLPSLRRLRATKIDQRYGWLPAPPALIPKGLASAGLLAFIATAKFLRRAAVVSPGNGSSRGWE